MKLRVATLQDIPTLVQFGEAFFNESPNYQGRKYEPKEAAKHYENLMRKECVIFVVEQRGQVVGGFAGGIVS